MRNYKKEYVYLKGLIDDCQAYINDGDETNLLGGNKYKHCLVLIQVFSTLPVAPVWFNETDLNNLMVEFLNK